MNAGESRRVELYFCRCEPCCWSLRRSGVLAAFAAIGDTFLVVFIGIFLRSCSSIPMRYPDVEDEDVARGCGGSGCARHVRCGDA